MYVTELPVLCNLCICMLVMEQQSELQSSHRLGPAN